MVNREQTAEHLRRLELAALEAFGTELREFVDGAIALGIKPATIVRGLLFVAVHVAKKRELADSLERLLEDARARYERLTEGREVPP